MQIVLILVFLFIVWSLIYETTYKTENNRMDETIRILARQCARWAVAAEQDRNSIIATLHANYGAGYLWALEDFTNPQEFQKATGLDFVQFKKEIVRIQDKATRDLVNICPSVKPTESVLLQAIYGIK